MARLIDRPITVRTNPDGGPYQFFYQGRQYRIQQVLEVWQEAGEWWEGQGERIVYRVVTTGGGIFELDFRYDSGKISRSVGAGQWFLYKVYD